MKYLARIFGKREVSEGYGYIVVRYSLWGISYFWREIKDDN